METFLTTVKNQTAASSPSQRDKGSLASTALEGSEQKNGSITLVKIQSSTKEKLKDEAAEREERIHKCIEAAVYHFPYDNMEN